MIKIATILFADVVGSTAMGEGLEPDELRALLAELFGALSEEVIAAGGTVEKIIGDAITGVFGVPVAHEDDACRAVKTGLKILQRVQQINASKPAQKQIRIRIGINTGRVSAQGSFAPRLLVVGDAANVAARLQAAAAPDTILVGESTARAVRHLFHLREIEAVAAKGKTAPLKAFAVEGVRETPDRPLFSGRMVGRDAEMKMLRSIFAASASEGSTHLVITVGEPGLGKTRLVDEFLSSIEGRAGIIRSNCLPYGSGVTLWPLRDILAAEAGFVNVDPPEVVRERVLKLISRLLPQDDPNRVTSSLLASIATDGVGDGSAAGDPRRLQAEMFWAWQTFLGALAADRPLVVVIDDLHWADQSMLELLEHLVETLDSCVLFVCAARPDILVAYADWLARLKRCSTIRLEPLEPRQLGELVSDLLGGISLPGEFNTTLASKVEGNPFFLSEILQRLADEGALRRESGGWRLSEAAGDVPIPDNVQSVILARLDLLAADEKAVLQRAAVIGRSFSQDAVSALCGVEDLEAILSSLQQRHLIARYVDRTGDGNDFAFRHVLIRDVAYESLPRRRRGESHATLVKWIERVRQERTHDVAEILGHHANLAYEFLEDDEFRRRAREYYMVAARTAARRFASLQAEQLCWQAVDLSTEQTERINALEVTADIYYLTGKSEVAWTIYMDALKDLGASSSPDAIQIGRICANAAIIPTRQWGSVEERPSAEDIQHTIKTGLDAVSGSGTAEECLLLVSEAFFHADAGRSEEARGAAEAALALADRLDDADLMSAALDSLSAYYMHPNGRYGDVKRVTSQRLTLVPRLSDLAEVCDTYGMAAVSETLIGNYPKAVEHATQSSEVGRQLDVASYLHALNWRMHARFMTGDWDGAMRDEAEIARLEERDPISMPGPYSARSAAAALFISELRDATDLEGRLEIMRRYRQHVQRSINITPLAARALAHMGAADEAWTWIDLSRRMYRAAHLEAACEIVAAQLDWDRAERVIRLARDEASTCGLLALSYFADRLEGLTFCTRGNHELGLQLLKRSAEGFTILGALWEAAWSDCLIAEELRQTGEVDQALDRARVARAVFDRLGSVVELKRVDDILGSRV